jgi:hypothetical protein
MQMTLCSVMTIWQSTQLPRAIFKALERLVWRWALEPGSSGTRGLLPLRCPLAQVELQNRLRLPPFQRLVAPHRSQVIS